jgi:hypothetical protein
VDNSLVHPAIHRRRWYLLPLGVFLRTFHLFSLATYIHPNVPSWLPHNPGLPLLEPGYDLGKGRTCNRRGANTELLDALDRGGRRRQVARAK